MGTACISGCGDIVVDEAAKVFSLGGRTYHEGDYISLDGSTERYMTGILQRKMQPSAAISAVLSIGRIRYRVLKVRTNADAPKDSSNALKLGCRGRNRALPYGALYLDTQSYPGNPQNDPFHYL